MTAGRLPLTVAALGIVFGDIGTSPLYAFREAARAAPVGGELAILGVLSLIIWAIILSVSVKYVSLVLRCDNDGEGGILALATLLDLQHFTPGTRGFLLFIALLGAAMLFGDGVITPAISVLSAVEGLQYVAPAFGRWEVPITIVILIFVYLSQRAGTHRIGVLFGPIMLVWFVSIGVLGLIHALQHPVVFTAFNPIHGVRLLMASPFSALAILSAVFLAITGGEALYADLGQFGRKVIARAWYYVALPGLLLNYFGQGALILAHPEALQNPFYLLAPNFLRLPMLILATAATVIASQAVITGVFSLTKQAIETNFMPPLSVTHTAESNESHVYIGTINVILAVLSIATVIAFQSSDALSHAYGIAVSTAMITTTVLYVSAQVRMRRWPKYVTYVAGACLLLIDLAFFLPNLEKLDTGGELPLSLAGAALLVMVAWRVGTRRMGIILNERGRVELNAVQHADRAVGASIHRCAVVLSRTSTHAPIALGRLHELLGINFDRMILVNVKVAGRPRVGPEDRLKVEVLSSRLTRIELAVGYMQSVNLPALLAPGLREVSVDPNTVIYVVGHERPLPPRRVRSLRDLLSYVFVLLVRNAARAADRFNLPSKRTLEVGYPLSLDVPLKPSAVKEAVRAMTPK